MAACRIAVKTVSSTREDGQGLPFSPPGRGFAGGHRLYRDGARRCRMITKPSAGWSRESHPSSARHPQLDVYIGTLSRCRVSVGPRPFFRDAG